MDAKTREMVQHLEREAEMLYKRHYAMLTAVRLAQLSHNAVDERLAHEEAETSLDGAITCREMIGSLGGYRVTGMPKDLQ